MNEKDKISSTNNVIVEILAKYKWIHNFQVTKFFIDEPWNHIPEEVKTLQVFMLNEEQIKIYVYAYIGFFILDNLFLLLFYYMFVCFFFTLYTDLQVVLVGKLMFQYC